MRTSSSTKKLFKKKILKPPRDTKVGTSPGKESIKIAALTLDLSVGVSATIAIAHRTLVTPNVKPIDDPKNQGAASQTMNSAVASRHVNVVVSRSTVRRKPPLRGNSGDRLVEMRRGATERAMTPNTPMSNRQRLATMAAMEMSTNSFGSDDGTLNSNTSTGSISLKSPGGNRNREREEHSVRRRRSSSQKASTARTSSRRKERSSGERGLPKERPSSVSSLQVEEGESAKLCADDASSRSERRMDRSRAGGSSTGGVGSNRQRSSSRRRGERGQRSNSLNEKRNGRTHRISTSEVVGGDAPRKSPGVYHRSSVTEDEIMDLLSLDYTTPITQSRRRHSDSSAKKESIGSTTRRSVKESNRTSRDSSGSPQMGSSRDRRERSDKSPRNLSREGCRSIDQVGGYHSLHKRNSADSSKNRDRRDTTELERSSSTGSFERKMHSPSSSVSGKIIRRNTPRRAKSEDHGLNSFLQQDMSVSRRKNPASGSRSVASMPAKAVARRRRGSVGAMSDRTDATEETTKPCSSSDVMADDDHLIDHDVTDEEDDCASIDLDLATAHSNFLQTSLDAKVQMYLSKTDELLYSVFPKHIADALRNGQKVEPENHDLVTIFFSDIVGFTDISSKLDPMKISELLDRLYNSFDALSEYHDVFKVET